MATSSDDRLTLLSGTGQNVAGLVVYVLASFAANVLIFRGFGAGGAAALGLVTLATQLAFVGGRGDPLRDGHGGGAPGGHRGRAAARRGARGAIVRRAFAIAAAASVAVAAALFLLAGPLADAFAPGTRTPRRARFRAAALALPFVALCQVYLGGTRGLKIMRHTLYVYWAGQPLAWIALTLAFWAVDKSIASTVLAYAGSWALATGAAWFLWRRETRALRGGADRGGRDRAGCSATASRAPRPRCCRSCCSGPTTSCWPTTCTRPRTSACTRPRSAWRRRWCCS